MFTGHGAIDIADEVMIANKVNLVTAGHHVEPDKRRAYIAVEPITVEATVWIGTAATVLPGVTIGADSVAADGAVVTHDVPAATLVAGVPAGVSRTRPPGPVRPAWCPSAGRSKQVTAPVADTGSRRARTEPGTSGILPRW
jgi:acetyltransferase-like isoleucine patch superfamily enzyme